MKALLYDVHGVGLQVRCDDSRLAAAVASRLRHWSVPSAEPAPLRIDFVAGGAFGTESWASPRPGEGSRPVYDPPVGEVSYAEGSDRLTIRYAGGVGASCDVGAGRAVISFDPAREEDVWSATHPILTLCLVEMLRGRGLYSLHAASLAVEGAGLLIAGSSGAGKSTLTLALLRAGFDFLGDDTCFLAPGETGARVLAFPDEMDVTDRTLDFFPELGFLRSRPKPPGSGKRQMLPEEVYGIAVASECAPAVIVFPRVGAGEASVLHEIGAAEAMMELVPNVLLTDPSRAQAHLDAIARLVAECRCYRLSTGRDFDLLGTRLRALLHDPVLSPTDALTAGPR